MQKRVENKVLEYCKKHKLLDKGDRVVVGVSGGADSVCLLFVLLSLQEKYDLHFSVVHVHHGIRPEADEDAAYVKKICQEKGIPFTYVRREIPAEAKALGCSEEEAGRRARYEVFEEILQKEGGGKIAVAHNANDRAETMLFHLFRGTGLTGLSSIKPLREQVIRPILCLERWEIEAYLESLGVAYCHDKTNDSDDYTRNKIRHHILPFAEAEIVNGAVGNMVRTADILAETENYIEEQVEEAKKTLVQRIAMPSAVDGAGYKVDCAGYLKLHSVLKKRLLLTLLKELSPMHKDIGAVHVEAVHALFEQEGNRQVHLPYRIRGRREYEAVLLERSTLREDLEEEVLVGDILQDTHEVIVQREDGIFTFTLWEVSPGELKDKDIPQNQYTKWFDYDKIKECLVIRYRQTGDYLCTGSGGNLHHKKIKDYMIDEKIPERLRDRISLPTDGAHVLWVPGYRISEYYKVDSSTKRILQISYQPTENLSVR